MQLLHNYLRRVANGAKLVFEIKKHEGMFKLEKQSDKAVLTIYGYVGGYYLDFRAVNAALEDITKSGFSKLDFHIHTYGGTVFDGNLIYNFISSFKGEVDIYIDGIAASMGAIIIMAGTRIHIAENGYLMIHAPRGGASGTAKDLEQSAKLLRSMGKNFSAKLVARTGKTEQEVNAWLDGTDYWFDADEAIALKLADDKFDAKGIVAPITMDEVKTLGAEAVFNKFAACLETESQIPKSEMNKDDLIKRYGLTTVTAQSTDEEVLAAVDAKINASANAAKEATTAAIVAVVDQAIADKKITKEQKDSYVARGEKLGVAELTAVFGDMKPYEPISSHVQGGKGGDGKPKEDRKDWTFDDYQAKAPADLEAMPKNDPETFKAIYKAKFGVTPEI